MWNMFDDNFFECNKDTCDGPGPPPKFHIPPPPRPPFMQDLFAGMDCNEDPLADVDMCAAFPVRIFFFFLYHFASKMEKKM